MAVDGDLTTSAYTLNGGHGPWLAVDIGQPTNIGAVEVYYFPYEGNI